MSVSCDLEHSGGAVILQRGWVNPTPLTQGFKSCMVLSQLNKAALVVSVQVLVDEHPPHRVLDPEK